MGAWWCSDFDLPAHQLRQQQVAGGAEFLVLLGESRHLVEAIGGEQTEFILKDFRRDDSGDAGDHALIERGHGGFVTALGQHPFVVRWFPESESEENRADFI